MQALTPDFLEIEIKAGMKPVLRRNEGVGGTPTGNEGHHCA